MAPNHLAPIVDALERVEVEPVFALISTPPQHGKTETILQGIVWLMDRNPTLRIAYVSYIQSFSDKQASQLRRYASAAGLQIDKSNDARRFWRTPQGGYFVATSIGGELTGLGFDLIVVDDPFKDRKHADSSLTRDTVYDWFSSAALTRLSPTGSVVVVHTRWHLDDLIGRLALLEGEDKWQHISLPAINEYGEALWSEVRPIEWLEKQQRKLTPYDWAALYQGQPRVKGEELFRTPVRYERPHLRDSRIVIACDPAASEKTSADYSAAVVLAVHGYDDAMRADVLDVVRVQKEIPELCKELEQLQTKWQAPIHIESIGIGKAVPQFLRMINPRLDIREISGKIGDKYSRAQPVSAAWNQGRVRVPMDAPWLIDFNKEVQEFTGVGDRHDDQVDALAHAWNVAAKAVSPGIGLAPWHDEEVSAQELEFQEYMRNRETTLFGDAPTVEQHQAQYSHTRYGYKQIEWYTGMSRNEHICLDCYDTSGAVEVIQPSSAGHAVGSNISLH